MRFFARLSPLRAIQDLRIFLSQRQPYEIWFMMLSIVVTGGILIGFVKDSAIAPVYKPNIIYVQQWTADRTDAQIRAQQKIDQVQVEKDKAELKRRQEALQAGYKRLDDKLKRYGL